MEKENKPKLPQMGNSFYKLVDIGANLWHPAFQNDHREILERAKLAGIQKLMITGCDEKSTKIASKMAEEEDENDDFLFYTAGVHPYEAKNFVTDSALDFIEDHLKENPQKCVAVGECGLDFKRNDSPRDKQIDVFEKQSDNGLRNFQKVLSMIPKIKVKIACEYGKPLFIHERDAHLEMVEILCRHAHHLPPAVIHCFTGTIEEAQKYMEMGLYIGLTGFLWKDRRQNGVQKALEKGILPKEKLLLESDAPFLYPNLGDKRLPAEIRAKLSEKSLLLHKYSSFLRNEPSSLAAICELIAAFMDESPAEIARITSENAYSLFFK